MLNITEHSSTFNRARSRSESWKFEQSHLFLSSSSTMQYSLAFAALVATACASSLADNTENTFHGQLLPVKKLLRSPTLPACAHQTLPRPFHLAKKSSTSRNSVKPTAQPHSTLSRTKNACVVVASSVRGMAAKTANTSTERDPKQFSRPLSPSSRPSATCYALAPLPQVSPPSSLALVRALLRPSAVQPPP